MTHGLVAASLLLALADASGQPWPRPIPGFGPDGVPPVAPWHLQADKSALSPSLRRTGTLSVSALRLASASPNVLGRVQAAVDPESGRIYASAGLTEHVVELDGQSGRFLRAFRLSFFSGGPHKLLLAAKHGVLFHVSQAGAIRAVDLRLGQQTALIDLSGPKLAQPALDASMPCVLSPVVDERDASLIVIQRAKQLVCKYDKGLRQQAVWSVGKSPSHLHLDSEHGRLWVLGDGADGMGLVAHGVDLATGEVVARHRVGTEPVRALRGFARGAAGDFYLMGEALRRVSPEGVRRWSVRLPGAGQSVHILGDCVAVVCRDAQARSEHGVACGSVELMDAQTGRLRASVKVGLDAQAGALDPARARLVVGNAGDASVSVVDLRAGREAGRYPVGASAEQVVPHPKGHALYVLNRLGGGDVYCYHARTGKHETLSAGQWPAAMALDARGERLYVLSHYESRVYAFDTATNREVLSIGLGLPGCETDSLSHMSYDRATGRLYCSFPDTGSVVVVDTHDPVRTSVFRPLGLRPERDAGPGRLQAAGDGRGRAFYVVAPSRKRVWIYDSGSGELLAWRSLAHSAVGQGGEERGLLFADPSRGRMFVGPCVLSMRKHVVRATLRGVERVIAQRGGHLLATRIDARGREVLCIFDADTLREVGSVRLLDGHARASCFALDTARNRLYAAHAASAQVLVFALPSDLASIITRTR